jgi:nitroreductase
MIEHFCNNHKKKEERMDTLEAISKRASLKTHLSAREVEQEKISKVLEAGSLAPSGRNQQPWRFIVVKGKENVEKVVTTAFFEFSQVFKEAPVLIFLCANPGDDDIHEGREYYLFDSGLAFENLLIAATDLGLVTHPMSSVNEDKLKEALNIPDEVRFIAATPLSYPSADSYDEAAKEKLGNRTRKSLKEIAYSGKWGNPL